jgi:hypothetical protein
MTLEETRYCVMLSNIQNQIDPEGKWQNLRSYRSPRFNENGQWQNQD